jgi:hypothetical protein
MSPDKQRIAIAEACGWTKYKGSEKFQFCSPRGMYAHMENLPKYLVDLKNLPKYLVDLNAMHEAEKVLDYNQMNQYQNIELSRFVRTGTTWICRATAAERAEAFLRTLGKWEDDK